MKRKSALARELIALRKASGLSQKELAKKAGRGVATVCNAEGSAEGDCRRVRLETIDAIYRVCLKPTPEEWERIEAAWLVAHEDYHPANPDAPVRQRKNSVEDMVALLRELRADDSEEEDWLSICGALQDYSSDEMAELARLLPKMVGKPQALAMLRLFLEGE